MTSAIFPMGRSIYQLIIIRADDSRAVNPALRGMDRITEEAPRSNGAPDNSHFPVHRKGLLHLDA